MRRVRGDRSATSRSKFVRGLIPGGRRYNERRGGCNNRWGVGEEGGEG